MTLPDRSRWIIWPTDGRVQNASGSRPDAPIEVVPAAERDRYRKALERIAGLVAFKAASPHDFVAEMTEIARDALDERQRDA